MADEFASIDSAQPKRNAQPLHADTRRTASAGLMTVGGQIQLNYGDPLLRSAQHAMRVFMEMGDDPTIGSLFYLMLNVISPLEWGVREFSPDGKDVENAQFLKSCMNDMEVTWDDFIQLILRGMVQFGFAPFEMVYKVRDGRSPADENAEPSLYSDKKIGWSIFQNIGQDTITKWDFDDNNRVMGIWQQASPTFRAVLIPAIKLVNFRMATFRDNPMGESVCRRAWPAFRQKKALENIEGVAIERESCGLPVAKIPIDILMDNASPGRQKLKESLKRIVCDMRTDEQMGVLWPSAYDANGNEMYKLELLTSGGSRSIDVSSVIQRYEVQIFRTVLADFLGLGAGSNSSGSWAMHNDKSQLFLMGLRAYLKNIVETLNRVVVPRLFALNGVEANGYPQIYHTPLDQIDVQQLAAAISSLSGAGMPIFPNEEIERRIYEILGLPAPVDEGAKQDQELEVNTQLGSDKPEIIKPGDARDEAGRSIDGAKPLGSTAPYVDRDKADEKQRPKSLNRIG